MQDITDKLVVLTHTKLSKVGVSLDYEGTEEIKYKLNEILDKYGESKWV